MFCTRLNGTLSISACIKRQELAKDILETKDNPFYSLKKCLYCFKGVSIRKNPNPLLDADIRALLREYKPRPEKYQLNIKPPKYRLKIKEVIIIEDEQNERIYTTTRQGKRIKKYNISRKCQKCPCK